MKVIKQLPIAFFLVFFTASACATWVWLSPQEYLRESDLIVILDVGPIHRVATPEGIVVESATAKVEKVIWYKFESDEKLPDKITLYNIFTASSILGDKTIPAAADEGVLVLKQGRIFALLQKKGSNEFKPFDRLSIQELGADEKVLWTTSDPMKSETVSISRIIEELDKIKQSQKTGAK